MDEQNLIIPLALAQRLLNYITANPSPNVAVGDVLMLVNELQQLKELKQEEKE